MAGDPQPPRVRRAPRGAAARLARGVDGCRSRITTSAGTARATRRAWRARTSRSPAASWPSPTCSTSSPPRAPTRSRATPTPRATRSRAAQATQFDPRVVRAFLSISLGRLRLAMGPLSWLAQAPVLGRIPLAPGIATARAPPSPSSARSPPGSWAPGRTSPRNSHRPRRRQDPRACRSRPAAGSPRLPACCPAAAAGRPAHPHPRRRGAVLNELLAALPVPGDPTPPQGRSPRHPPRPHPRHRPRPHPPPAAPPAPPAAPAGPSFAPGADQNVREDAGPQRVRAWADEIRGRA